jgi:tyrosyl-tRNA synthetase
MAMLSSKEQVATISRGTVTLTPVADLLEKLKENRPLRVKIGADPTAPDLHLGHAVVLSKLREMQDLGHNVLFLIGDFTARIGDPTGKSKTRPPLSVEEIKHNSATYFEQVFRILDKEKTEVLFNTTWLEPLTFADIIKLCAKVTVMQVLEREDFKNRINKHVSISFHELLYPLLQGYDSVFLKADLEAGGTDQTFNMMFGRQMQEQFGQKPQVVLAMPLLEGLDGKNKMSKSLGNYIGLTDKPQDAYGKLMSMPDSNLISYNRLLLCKSEAELTLLQEELAAQTLHPMAAKKKLAFEVVAKYWGVSAAQEGQFFFEAIFQKQDYTKAVELQLELEDQGMIWIVELLRQAGIAKTSSDAKRLLEQKSVFMEELLITDFKARLKISGGELLKVGKKVLRLGVKR